MNDSIGQELSCNNIQFFNEFRKLHKVFNYNKNTNSKFILELSRTWTVFS